MKKVKAFTLIELLIVIAIIAILATIIIVSFSNSQVKARDSKRMSDLAGVEKALDVYRLDNGSYPVEAASCELSDYSASVPDCTTLSSALVSAGLLGELPADPKPSARGFAYRFVSSATRYSLRAYMEGTPVPVTANYPGTTSATNSCWKTNLIAVSWYEDAVYSNVNDCNYLYVQKGRQ